MEKISLLLLVVKKSLIGAAIVSALGFCGLYNFYDTCVNESNQVEKTIKQGPTGGRDQMPRTFFKQGPTGGRDQMPRTYKQGPTGGRDQMPRT